MTHIRSHVWKVQNNKPYKFNDTVRSVALRRPGAPREARCQRPSWGDRHCPGISVALLVATSYVVTWGGRQDLLGGEDWT